LFFIFFYFIYG
jgi:hypothetical protein